MAALVVGETCAGEENHWAFERLERADVPAVKDEGWVRDDLDRFVRAAQEERGISPNEEVDRRRYIRRVTMDLTGLPPRPDEIEEFLIGDTTGAHARLVDRLLASKRYGERWGRHWLDVARYADSLGYRYDDDIPGAWAYRDYVIGALNEDQPFDEFVRWQLAGDELVPGSRAALAATGFCAVGPRPRIEGTELNKKEARYIEIDDIVATTFQAYLGLSMDCARCHDHKFDPITQEEYYSVAKAFLSGERKSEPYLTTSEDAAWKRWRSKHKRIVAEFEGWKIQNKATVDRLAAKLKVDYLKHRDEYVELFLEEYRKEGSVPAKPKQLTKLISKEGKRLLGNAGFKEWAKLQEKIENFDADLLHDRKTLQSNLPPVVFGSWLSIHSRFAEILKQRPPGPPMCAVYVDKGKEVMPSPLMERGEVASPGRNVELGFLSVLQGGEVSRWRASGEADSTYQRATLANWLTDVEEGAGGLLARVIVNRIWFYHFGEGLVRTPNDFGKQGDRPALPELLDYLALELIESGWSLKALHRRICLSATYRQGTQVDDARMKVDPENRSWWRRRPVRVEAEVLRDSMLQVGGRIRHDGFGRKPVMLPIPEEVIISRLGKAYPKDVKDGPEVWCRSVYAFSKRTVPVPILRAFDAPDRSESCARRVHTTVATQALVLMNDEFVRARSRDFARRVMSKKAPIHEAFVLALGRPASDREQKRARTFLDQQLKLHRGQQLEAWTDFCQTLFSLNEFSYVD